MLEKIEKICDVAVDYAAEDVFLQVGELPSMRVKGKVLELEDAAITDEEIKEFSRMIPHLSYGARKTTRKLNH